MSKTIATLGPEGSHDWEAARRYQPNTKLLSFPHISAVIGAFVRNRADLAVIPVYNTRDGERKEFLRAMAQLGHDQGYWIDNLVLPVELSLGGLDEQSELKLIIGESHVLKQCSEFLAAQFPDTSLMATHNLDSDLAAIRHGQLSERGVIAPEKLLVGHGLVIRQREVAPFNRTRYAVLGLFLQTILKTQNFLNARTK